MKPATQIFRWLHAIKVDRRLNPTCGLVALQLTDKTNEREFARSGTLITWQAEVTIALAIGRCERTVRSAIKLMARHGYVLIKGGHGKGKSNQYTLTLPNRQEVAAYGGSDSGKELPVSTDHKRQTLAPIAASFEPASGKKLPPNLSTNHFYNLADDRDTDDRGPRRRANALGPLDADLRQRLGERFEYLAAARLVGHSKDTITLSVLTVYQADNVRRYCEADILVAAGATELKFIVEIAADTPNARRLR